MFKWALLTTFIVFVAYHLYPVKTKRTVEAAWSGAVGVYKAATK